MGFAACFAAGAWGLQQQAFLPSPALAAVVVALFAVARVVGGAAVPGARAAQALARCAAWVLAGFVWAGVVAQVRLADALPSAAEGRDLPIEGSVAGLPERTPLGWRFGFRVSRALAPVPVPHHLLLTLVAPAADSAAALPPPFVPGEQLTLTARLQRPHGLHNPHGGDGEAWLLEHGIRATGYVRDQAPLVRHGIDSWDVFGAIDRARLAMREKMLAALGDAPLAGVLVALAIGDQAAVSPDQWRIYTVTGVNHLMSISGLHVTMFAAGAGWVGALLLRRLPARWRPASVLDAAGWAGLAAAFGYALVSGFAVPAQRTLWMLAAVVVARSLRTSLSPWDVLGLALFVVIAAEPLAVMSAGFWLSFGAVAFLVFAAAARAEGGPWWRAWSRAQWVLFLGLAPLLLGWFQQISLVSPLANAVAVPLVSFVVVPLSLAAAVLPGDVWAQAGAGVLGLLHSLLEAMASWPAAVYVQHAPGPAALALALAGVVWMLLPRGLPSRWLGGLLVLPAVCVVPPGPAWGEAWVTMLDVGQGLAVVVRTHREALLFDTGPAWSSGTDAGARVISPYLRGEGVSQLAAMVVSHDDRDHTGGAVSVLQAIPAPWILAPARTPMASAPGRRVSRCAAGAAWEWSGVRFDILHPDWGPGAPAKPRDNATSCVLKVSAPGGRVLIAADIERDVEARLLARFGSSLAADVLIAPHHGSRTSSSPAFVAAVGPKEVWFAVGYRNRFGHPHDDVVARYREQGARLLRSDTDGALTARLGAGGVMTSAWRRTAPRYWHTPPSAGTGRPSLP